MAHWSDFFRLFTYAQEKDPLARQKDSKQFQTAGVTLPDALTVGGDIGQSSYRQTTDMVDTTTLTNRPMRYKEYERLRNVPEIESAMQILADEACVAGDTKIATPFGFITIKELAEKKSDERFLVYSYDFKKKDYTLGWAFAPRLVKEEQTVTVLLDNGGKFTTTADHKVLKKDGTWVTTGELKTGDELMPFYRKQANSSLNKIRHSQYARIFSFEKGWVHERQFVDDWKTGKVDPYYERINKVIRMLGAGLTATQIVEAAGHEWDTLESWLNKAGFSIKELRWLGKHKKERRIIGIIPGPVQPVYDISVDEHRCFATDSVILHNCQKDDDDNVFKIETKNDDVREEVEFLLLNRKMLNMNRNATIWFKNLCIFGDWFVEMVINPDNPKEGIYRGVPLPPETMFRIESIKGKLLEFQQTKEAVPDYQSLLKGTSGQNEMELHQSTAIRFAPSQIVHFRIGDDRKTFYPYGQSLIEPARGPAHSLRLMEDAMLVYRLTRAPERRVFYIDVGQLPPFKAEAFIDRLKDQFRKRKIANNRAAPGANSVEERWQPPAQDEDYWLPIRPNSNTKIDTLPGAENLGEIDDAVYFRNKLLTALNFPKNYFNNEDPGGTRITLSAQDVKFARMIERLQSHFEDGILEIVERHLQLRGFPEESYQDLKIKMTPPSDWRELSRAEVVTARYGNAGTLKSGQLMSDYDIYLKILKYSEDDATEMLARLKLQKLEDLKLQVLAQNPALLGIGIPGQDANSPEIGSDPGSPAAMPAPDGGDGGTPPPPTDTATGAAPEPLNPGEGNSISQTPPESVNIPEPDDEDVKKYDLEIQDYETDQDHEDIDYSVGD